MNLEAFVRDGADDWTKLERALERAGDRPEGLGVDGVLELGRVYRIVAADLALARRAFPGDPVVDRLEALALRGRRAIYSERRRGGTLRAFAVTGYWREVYESWRVLALAVVAMAAPTLLTAVWALNDPGAAIGLIPSVYRGAASPHAHHLPEALSTQAAFASSIYTHNIAVTFAVFAGGLTLGLGTLALLAYNGLLLGTLAGLTLQAGTFSVFVRYVVPHGLLELSCIAVAGAAGLRLARALVDPGVLPRGESLRREARPAVQMVLGTAPWLVVAGTTEGLLTPRGLPVGAALGVGLFLAGVFWTLVLWRGRQSRPRDLASRYAPTQRSANEPAGAITASAPSRLI
jgi:uncharacterized membrane protein SpoIIM required for sporulation